MAKNEEKQLPNAEDDLAAQRLLKEADEALRHDRLQALWNEWGSTIIGVALMLVLGTALGVGWRNWQSQRQSELTALLLQADQNPQAIADLNDHYRGIASLLNAARVAENRDTNPQDINTALSNATDSGLPQEWNILAQWGALRTQADSVETDEEKIIIAVELANIARQNNNPYSAIMLMESGVLQGEAGNLETAIALLNEASTLPTNNAVPDLKNRIDIYLQLYQTEATL